MDDSFAMNEDWDLLRSFFPEDWEILAVQSGALKGLRKNKSADHLLRTLLMHIGCGHSLRETTVRAKQANLAQISDVALLKRLRKSAEWLHCLCRGLLKERLSEFSSSTAPAMHLLDSSIITEPGKTGSQWRLHYSLQWPSLSCDFFKLTPVKGKGNGENLTQFPVNAGEHYLADRGYSSASGIRHVAENDAYLTVRLNPDAVRLYGEDHMLFPLIQKLEAINKPDQIGQWQVVVADSSGAIAARGRLCVIRKSQEAIRLAQAKLKRKARKNGTNLQTETLEYAKFVMVFTTFEENQFPAAAVLQWYRLRWQIELVFKRFKQISELGHLPKRDPESSRAWLYGKLLVALLSEKLMAYAQSFSPWGYDMGEIAHSQQLA
jgi:hypothetical protein